MISNRRLLSLGLILFWMCSLGFGCFFQSRTALAASVRTPPGYSISVTESSPTIPYGVFSGTLTAQLTVPADEPAVDPANFFIKVDSQTYHAPLSGSSSPYAITVVSLGGTILSMGKHTVVADYYSPKLQTTIESAPITLTVVKPTPLMDCGINIATPTLAPRTPLTVTVSFGNTDTPVDWQDGTFTITFVGKRTFTNANLKANSSEQLIVPVPSVPDVYQDKCLFSGTASFNPVASTLSLSTLVVSENHQIGGIKLYTNPTTISRTKPTTYKVVILAAPGLPTPTGNISLVIGTAYTSIIALGAGGTVTFQANAPSPFNGTTIRVNYDGDPVYTWTHATFPLTNPPIGSGNPPSNPAPAPGTATPSASVTPTSGTIATNTPNASATPTNTATAANGVSVTNSTPGSPANQGSSMLWIVLVVFVVLVGGTTVLILLLKRSAALRKVSSR